MSLVDQFFEEVFSKLGKSKDELLKDSVRKTISDNLTEQELEWFLFTIHHETYKKVVEFVSTMHKQAFKHYMDTKVEEFRKKMESLVPGDFKS